jgi:hypothetical protein
MHRRAREEGRVTESHAGRQGRAWLRPWLVVALAAWIQVGVIVVGKAAREGLVQDITFSPYHVVAYAALVTLGVYVAWAFFRALRKGDWRHAYPPLYGGLALGFVFFVAWIILEPVWGDTLGIDPGISEGLAPTRLPSP